MSSSYSQFDGHLDTILYRGQVWYIIGESKAFSAWIIKRGDKQAMILKQ